ncbi:MAG: ATP-binding protein [Calditrichia bacterium]
MKQYFSTLYSKISVIFLVLLIVLGITQITVFTRFANQFMLETDQKLNLTLAKDLASKFQPYLNDSIDVASIEHSFHEMMVMNPRVEFYLLDSLGNILAYFAEPGKVKKTGVSLAPIKKFLKGESFPILGEDPRGNNILKPISVTPVSFGRNGKGYLYVILGGEQFDSALAMLKDSFILKSAFFISVVNIGLTAVIGLLLFFLLTRRLQRVTRTVRQFEQGDYHARIDLQSNDEIGTLANAYNHMAATINQHIEAIKNNDKLRRELIANISHDLRSPLASVLGYLETYLLKEQSMSPEQKREFLEIMYKNLQRLNKLVLELFELSKLDAGQVKFHMEPFSLAELCQDVILKFKPLAEKKRISVDQQFDKHISQAYGDIGMIERAISNLLDNALNYTPEGGKVTIILEEKDKQITVRITDTGYGIESQDLPHIFNRFYRVDKSRSSGSTGLGLAITKKIIEAHNSEIEVHSTVNQGTTFEFSLEKIS